MSPGKLACLGAAVPRARHESFQVVEVVEEHGARRGDYVEAFWSVIAWRQIEANFAAAVKA
jgi:hypothetical protein